MFLLHADQAAVSGQSLGGKAQTLASLAGRAIAIPEWCVVLPAAFEHSLTPEQRQWAEAGQMSAVFDSLHLATDLVAELDQAVQRLCPDGDLVAVRSSALDEDGLHHSFAGQLESFLFVPAAEVAARVVAVWRSGFSDRLLAYRREQGLTAMPSVPAVVIQRMVQAEVAGVAFSAHPITGQRRVALVSAVAGVGEALVSGAADAETYEVDRAGQVLRQTAVTEPPLLHTAQVQAIAQLARRVETLLGRPQDIEWAIERGQLYLLQARPITTLATVPDPDGALSLWDNSNIVESYSGVTTPLTYSFARRAYAGVYREFCRLMRVPQEAITQQDHTFNCMIGLVQGRVYYNLLNWYRVLALLPGFAVNRRFMEQMMGVKEELPAEVLASVQSATMGDRVKDGLRLAYTLVGLVQNGMTLPRQIRRFYHRLDRALTSASTDLTLQRLDELAAHYRALEHQLLTRWDAPLVNDFFAMIFYGVLRKLATAWCGDADGTLQNNLLSGEGGMVSAEPARCVRNMAETAQAHAALIASLCDGTLPAIVQQMARVPEFQAQYEAYLQQFGDRCLEELKLESPTLHDDPLLLLRSVGYLARQRATAPQAPTPLADAAVDLRHQAEQRVHQALRRQPLRRLIFNWVLRQTRARVRDRENLRFERTRLFGHVRRVFLEMGKRLYAQNQLNHPRDVFYLTLEELLGQVDGTTTCAQVTELVALRQAEFEHYRHLPPPPNRFSTRGAVHPLQPFVSASPARDSRTESVGADERQGLGACPGGVRAEVQVITNPKTAVLKPGCILVAEQTDPGWIMLFPAASGLLVERGSVLSHSAIVAREMGIPAIVSLPGVTQWLRDGDWVELDGSTGRVRRLPRESAEQDGSSSDSVTDPSRGAIAPGRATHAAP